MKLFGKELFGKRASPVLSIAEIEKERLKVLPDFYHNFNNGYDGDDYITISPWVTNTSNTIATFTGGTPLTKKPEQKLKPKIKLTPKDLHSMKWLNEKEFQIITNSEYVEEQVQQFKDKLELIQMKGSDMRNGAMEINSILIRMQNRKSYPKFEKFFQEFPYTTTKRITSVLDNNDHLKLGNVEQFVPSLPKEAVEVMKDYTKETQKLCEKKPIFYIIAGKEDFKQTNKRKDPILLAQSPFGHFWQILGAWDEEMILLEEL